MRIAYPLLPLYTKTETKTKTDTNTKRLKIKPLRNGVVELFNSWRKIHGLDIINNEYGNALVDGKQKQVGAGSGIS